MPSFELVLPCVIKFEIMVQCSSAWSGLAEALNEC